MKWKSDSITTRCYQNYFKLTPAMAGQGRVLVIRKRVISISNGKTECSLSSSSVMKWAFVLPWMHTKWIELGKIQFYLGTIQSQLNWIHFGCDLSLHCITIWYLKHNCDCFWTKLKTKKIHSKYILTVSGAFWNSDFSNWKILLSNQMDISILFSSTWYILLFRNKECDPIISYM